MPQHKIHRSTLPLRFVLARRAWDWRCTTRSHAPTRLRIVLMLIWPVILTVAPAWSQSIPIPDEAAQNAALALVNEVYKQDYDAAKTDEQKSALARKMLQQGAAIRNDPAGHYVLFRIAHEMAGKAGDVQLALQAIAEMQVFYQVDSLKLKAAVIADAAKVLRSPEEQQRIIKPIWPLIGEAIARDDYELSKALGEIAIASARKDKDTAVVKQFVRRHQESAGIAAAYAESLTARERLASKPTDPSANLTVGKFYCFVKADWVTGIPMLALGNDAELKPLAIQELDSPTEPLALGDAWWRLAESQDEAVGQRIRQHAAHWYEKALPSLSGLTRAKIEKRISDAEASEVMVVAREETAYKTFHPNTNRALRPQKEFFDERGMPPAVASNSLVIEGGELRGGVATNRSYEIQMGDFEWQDYDVHVECRHIERESILWLRTDPATKQGWVVTIGPWGPKNVDIRAHVTGEQWWKTPSRRWRPNLLSGRTDEWHTLDVSLRGTRITVRIDGRHVASSEHAKLTTGRIGIHFTDARWRNLEVRAPDGTLLWAGWPDIRTL